MNVRYFCFGIFLIIICSCTNNNVIVEGSGTIETTEIKVASKASGEIIELNCREGLYVKQGVVLAKVEHQALDLQLGQAKAGVDFAQAQLKLLLEGARSEDIIQTQEQVNQAKDNAEKAKKDYQRIKDLFDGGSATRKQLDDVEARYNNTRTLYNSAFQGLKKLLNLVRPEEVKAGKAKLEQSRFAVKILERMILDCTIIAPAAGIIVERFVEKGELVTQNTAVCVISDLSVVNLVIYLAEPYIGKIRLGMTVDIHVDSHPDSKFKGNIIYISPEAEFTPKNIQTRDERVKLVYAVKLEIQNPDGIFKPGMPADAIISLIPDKNQEKAKK